MAACPECGVEVSEENLGFHYMVMHKGSYPPGSEPPAPARVTGVAATSTTRGAATSMTPAQARYLINTLLMYGMFLLLGAVVLWAFAVTTGSVALYILSLLVSVPGFFVFLAGVVGKMAEIGSIAARPSD